MNIEYIHPWKTVVQWIVHGQTDCVEYGLLHRRRRTTWRIYTVWTSRISAGCSLWISRRRRGRGGYVVGPRLPGACRAHGVATRRTSAQRRRKNKVLVNSFWCRCSQIWFLNLGSSSQFWENLRSGFWRRKKSGLSEIKIRTPCLYNRTAEWIRYR